MPDARLKMFYQSGRMSTFGGPHDTGVARDEGLALYSSAEQLQQTLGDDWLLSVQQARAPGLARRLNPEKYYLAARWPVGRYPFLRRAAVWVENAAGKRLPARAVDWGPSGRTGRIADLSPGLARALDLDTDDHCTVTVYEDEDGK